MIVSHSHRFVFVHIPKNGGTTIERLLAPYLESGRDIHISKGATLPMPTDVKESVLKLIKHASAPAIRRRIGAEDFDSYFSFAFTRNPYARCYSAYRFQISRAEADIRRSKQGLAPARTKAGPDSSIFLNLSFKETCQNLPRLAKDFSLFQPQSKWLPDPNSVDYLGRLENLAEDLDFVFSKTGLPKEGLTNIGSANQKAAPNEWRAMTAECVAAIRTFYALDFERFGYSIDFEGPDTAPARPMLIDRGKRVNPGLRRRLVARYHDRVPQ